MDTSNNPTLEDVTPDPPLDSKMRCNNCGGRMYRSAFAYYTTFCPRCNMRHDWQWVESGSESESES